MEKEILKNTLPKEFVSGEYDSCETFKYADMEVIREHSRIYEQNNFKRWPGKHKYVNTWWELENGLIVGWNENPYMGWSFPIMKKPINY